MNDKLDKYKKVISKDDLSSLDLGRYLGESVLVDTEHALNKACEEIANCLSPIGTVFWSENKKRYKIAGVSSLDYLGLYKLYNYSEKSSYRLDVIVKDEVGIGKVEYEGTLDTLYKNDINKFFLNLKNDK